MTKRRKVWEPRAESVPDVLPEWDVSWERAVPLLNGDVIDQERAAGKIAWDAWAQVKGAPAFGSCRVVRVSK